MLNAASASDQLSKFAVKKTAGRDILQNLIIDTSCRQISRRGRFAITKSVKHP